MSENKELKVVTIPVGKEPVRRTIKADDNGSYLKGLQACVHGRIEPVGWVFDDKPTMYCNDEGLFGEYPNRAVYATKEEAEEGYLNINHEPAKEGDLVQVLFGDLVCCGFDPSTGEDIDITEEEAVKVEERFGGKKSIHSGVAEVEKIKIERETQEKVKDIVFEDDTHAYAMIENAILELNLNTPPEREDEWEFGEWQ